MDILVIVTLALMGALLGSFTVAQVWRLRAQQLVEDKQQGEPVDTKDLKRLKGLLRPLTQDRSECLSCHTRLAWYDLVPILSWLSLGGRCRYCKAPIGATEILAEVGLAAVFVISYIVWPYSLNSVGQVIPFALWLVACVVGAILLVYDAKWYLLPFSLNITLMMLGALYLGSQVLLNGQELSLLSLGIAILLLGGLYLLFSVFGWVGMGDGILGIGLALFLGNWQLAFLALFIANLLGCLMIIPLYIAKKLHPKAKIPFGPFLILATFISMLFGHYILPSLFTMTSNMLNTLML